MAAALNGLALHGGFIPYGGTFLVFADYARPAIRLAALMRQHVVYVLTHDSIGLGEDGPTHQPVETARFAACHPPHLRVFRPSRCGRDGGSLGAGFAAFWSTVRARLVTAEFADFCAARTLMKTFQRGVAICYATRLANAM